jgi:transcriptional regulator with GAF, ATPase, and Fis domain
LTHSATDSMMNYSQSPSVATFIVDSTSNKFELIYTKGFSEESNRLVNKLPLSGSATGLVTRKKELISIIQIASDNRLHKELAQSLLKENKNTAILIPLLHQEETVGVMNLLFQEQRILADYEKETLMSIGKIIALALVNARHLKRLNEEILKKEQTELELIKAREQLKDKVEQRTNDLVTTNQLLTEEIKYRKKIEKDLLITEKKFQQTVENSHTMGLCQIVGQSASMQNVYEIIQKTATSLAPVIIYGESGTGKELVAQAIHQLSDRNKKPYLKMNCAALNESLLESELFGHVKGAFTGAHQTRIGRFEAADTGNLFLDEIGDIPLHLQTKLLRVLETQQFERLGDNKSIKVNVRIISATNRNLEKLVEQNKMREDFFFRINVFPIYLPPLRERLDDIPLLVDHFIRMLCSRTNKKIVGLSPQVMEYFMDYRWPGNIRELKSTMEYAFVLAKEGLIEPEQLPAQFRKKAFFSNKGSALVRTSKPSHKVDQKAELIEMLSKCKGNKSKTARRLGVSRVTIMNRMKKYKIK